MAQVETCQEIVRSAAQAKTLQQALVKLDVGALGIVEQLAAPGHHLQKTAARSEIVLIRGEMLRQMRDALSENSDLITRTARILLVNLEFLEINFDHIIFVLLELIFVAAAIDPAR